MNTQKMIIIIMKKLSLAIACLMLTLPLAWSQSQLFKIGDNRAIGSSKYSISQKNVNAASKNWLWEDGLAVDLPKGDTLEMSIKFEASSMVKGYRILVQNSKISGWKLVRPKNSKIIEKPQVPLHFIFQLTHTGTLQTQSFKPFFILSLTSTRYSSPQESDLKDTIMLPSLTINPMLANETVVDKNNDHTNQIPTAPVQDPLGPTGVANIAATSTAQTHSTRTDSPKRNSSPSKPDRKERDAIAKDFYFEPPISTDLGEEIHLRFQYGGHHGLAPNITSSADGSPISNKHLEEERVVLITLPKNVRQYAIIASFDDYFTDTLLSQLEVGPLQAEFASSSIDDGFEIAIQGGRPPFKLVLLRDEEVLDSILLREQDGKYPIQPEEAFSAHQLEHQYQLIVIDSQGEKSAAKTWVKKAPKAASSYWFILLLLVLSVGIWGLYRYFQKSNQLTVSERQAIDERRKIQQEAKPQPQPTQPLIQVRPQASAVPAASSSGSYQPSTATLAGAPITNFRPQIWPTQTNPILNERLVGKVKDYRRFVMSEIWPNTTVSDVYMRDTVAFRINEYVFTENKALSEHKGEKQVEIGGWLLGKAWQHPGTQEYSVSFERFVQLQRAQSSDTMLEFKTHAWRLLDRAFDLYREDQLELVGWFHTHPGWGVFLSETDINTHTTFFQKPYHIALELESKKHPHELGFFTWRQEGEEYALNTEASSYHHWVDIRQWLNASLK